MNNQDEMIALALRLMRASRADKMGQVMINQYKALMPDIPNDFWDAIDPKELQDLIIPIYIKHFTAEDLQAAIEFHESPAGNKILDKAQIVMEESMKAGEQWGKELARRWEETHDVVC